jgi:hypothetical protein
MIQQNAQLTNTCFRACRAHSPHVMCPRRELEIEKLNYLLRCRADFHLQYAYRYRMAVGNSHIRKAVIRGGRRRPGVSTKAQPLPLAIGT